MDDVKCTQLTGIIILRQARNPGKASNGIRGNCELSKIILRQASHDDHLRKISFEA